MPIKGIVAICKNNGIGNNNSLPWNLPQDLKYFQKVTVGKGNNAIIMGKNTWNSIQFLKRRDHLIISSTLKLDYVVDGNIIKSFKSIDDVKRYLSKSHYDNIWVIGGAQIYETFINLNLLDEIYVTFIDDNYECDTYFPDMPNNYILYKSEVCNEKSNNHKYTQRLIYKKLKKDMIVSYKGEMWKIKCIHYDNLPDIYFTIENKLGREIQTIKANISLLDNNFLPE
jgi:dihydrofolate reductase